MRDGLVEFRAEQKVLWYGADPFFHLLARMVAVEKAVKLYTVELLCIVFQEVFFFCLFRVQLAYPVFTAPLCAAYVELCFPLAFLQHLCVLRRILG